MLQHKKETCHGRGNFGDIFHELLLRLFGIQEDHIRVSSHEPGAELRMIFLCHLGDLVIGSSSIRALLVANWTCRAGHECQTAASCIRESSCAAAFAPERQ